MKIITRVLIALLKREKIFKPAMLVILLLPDVAWGQAEGDLDEEFQFLEEEVPDDEVLSASKHQQSIFWSPSAINVLTRDDVERSGATTLPDLLRRIPGFDVYQLKPSFTLVGARSMTSRDNNRVLLLVDGREEFMEMSSFAFWNALSIDLEEVERVEIIRGPGSELYGANAVCGVVSITTKGKQSLHDARILLSAGENGQQRLFGVLRHHQGLGNGILSYHLAVGDEFLGSSSAADERMMGLLRTHAFLRYQEAGRLDVSLHAGGAFGETMMFWYSGDIQNDSYSSPWLMAQAKFTFSKSIEWSSQLYYNNYQAQLIHRMPLYGFGLWLADFPPIPWNSHTFDMQTQLQFEPLVHLLLIVGGNLRYSLAQGETLILEKNDEVRGAGFVHAQWQPFEILQLSAGARVDINDTTESAISPRVVVVLRPTGYQSFRLGFSTAFRKPSFLESRLHIKVIEFNPALPTIPEALEKGIGNLDLANEKLYSFEAGWRIQFLDGKLWLSVDAFYNLYRDTINLNTENLNILMMNSGVESNTVGGEAEVSWQKDSHWAFWANLGFRYSVDIGTDESVPYEPNWRFNVGGDYRTDNGLCFSLALHYVSDYSMPLVDPRDQISEDVDMPLGQHLMVIGRLGYVFPMNQDQNVEIGLTVKSPIGGGFREYAGIAMPVGFSNTSSDAGGEMIVRQIALYARANF